MKPLFIVTIFVLLYSCNNENSKHVDLKNTEKRDTIPLKYANYFDVIQFDSGYEVVIYNDKNHTKIKQKIKLLQSELRYNQIVNLPIKKIACATSTHFGFVNALQQSSKIIAVSDKKFFYSEKIINNPSIAEIGEGKALDIEMLIKLQPDVFFVTDNMGISAMVYKQLEKHGIPVITINEYKETHPLGKAEWLKFFAVFFQQTAYADSIFTNIEYKYDSIKQTAKNNKKQHSVLINAPWNGDWWLPSSNTYSVRLIADAGGEYLDLVNNGSLVHNFSIETVYQKYKDADIWLNCGMIDNLQDLILTDKRIGFFKAYQSKQVFNNNKQVNLMGANNYFEQGVIEPHFILNDIVKIFKNDTIFYKDFRYYTRLK